MTETNITSLRMGFPEDREPAQGPSMRDYCGSGKKRFNNALANRLLATLYLPDDLPEEARVTRIGAAMEAMGGFKPKNEIEGMLAAQAVAMHFAAMECFKRAMVPDQHFEVSSKLRRDGANMARGMADMLDALDRKRGKNTRQIVRVERVNVEAGGQAIVGNVATGGGVDGKSVAEPHAPRAGLAHDVGFGPVVPPVWSQDTKGMPVSGPGDDERAVPDARRQEHGAENRRRT